MINPTAGIVIQMFDCRWTSVHFAKLPPKMEMVPFTVFYVPVSSRKAQEEHLYNLHRSELCQAQWAVLPVGTSFLGTGNWPGDRT